MKTKIKICGITKKEEVSMLLENNVEFAGIVMFYEKSRRNNTVGNALKILKELKKTDIKTVAVVVSPTMEQANTIQDMKFDYIQIHGELRKEVLEALNIPVLRAFNITNMDEYEEYNNCNKIAGYVFDSAKAGSGKTFDWSLLNNISRNEKMFILAGGLNKENVRNAIETVNPNVVDVSSCVEGKDGKDAQKIKEFVREVRKGQI